MTNFNGFNLPEKTLGENKYIYGTYLESAFHNFYSVMRHIYFTTLKKDIRQSLEEIVEEVKRGENSDKDLNKYKKDGVPEDFGDELYWKVFFRDLNSQKPEIRAKAVEAFRKYFPFLEPFLDYTYEKEGGDKDTLCFVVLDRLYYIVKLLRLEFSHYRIEPSSRQKEIFENQEKWIIGCLKRTFDASKRVVKQRFSYTDEQMKCTVRIRVENDYSKKDKSGRPGKKAIEIPDFKYKLDRVLEKDGHKEWHLTSFAIVSIACLFLEKKYVQMFTDKLHCVLPADKNIINEMLAVYRLCLPVNKLDCNNDKIALGLDMLNELRKCPIELFEIIEPKNQNLFRIKSASQDDDSEVLLVRNKDRFATLLMKYIDQYKLFQDIRFQVSLGKYFYKFYNKRCIDSDEANRVRSLQKDLNGFGRLEEIEEERNIRWKDLIRKFEDVHQNTAEGSPYITDHRANYVFNGNRIGLWFSMGEKANMFLPDITTDGARCVPPVCWMSIYELPALALLLHLTDGKKVEKVIKQCVYSYRKLFTDIAEGILIPNENQEEMERIVSEGYKGIQFKDIPKKLQDYLLCKNVDMESAFNEWAQKYIQEQLEKTISRRTHFKDDRKMEEVKVDKYGIRQRNKQNRIGTKHYVELKAGRLADYLVKDFMLFQPSMDSGRDKLTGMNYQILQASLATYQDGDIDRITRILYSSHLVWNRDQSLDHPFLLQVLDKKPNNIMDFYLEYLSAKIDFLRNCLWSGVSYKSLYFLHPTKTKWNERNNAFYRSLASRYLKDECHGCSFEKSLELPRGLFEPSIRECLSNSENTDVKSIAKDGQYNLTYLIYAYFKHVIDDDCQNMYLFPRSYKLFNVLDKKRPTDPAVFYKVEDIYKLTQKKDGVKPLEHKVNKYIAGLFLRPSEKRTYRSLAEKQNHEREVIQSHISSMKATERAIKRYKIQDMLLFLISKGILKEALGDNQGTTGKIDRMALQNVEPNFNTLDITIPRFAVEVKSKDGKAKTVYQENIKLKNYSQFYRFLFDRRMPSLLNLTKENDIERSLIERELDSYDRAHLDVLYDVFELEKNYLLQNPEKESVKLKEVVADEPEGKVLQEIRNSFAHATYTSNLEEPKQAVMPEKATSIRDVLKDYVESKK